MYHFVLKCPDCGDIVSQPVYQLFNVENFVLLLLPCISRRLASSSFFYVDVRFILSLYFSPFLLFIYGYVRFKMGIVLQNLQKIVPVKRSRLRRDVETLTHIMGIQKFDLGIICVDNRKMQQINSRYRNKRSPTDVLSFPLYQVN